MTYDDWKAPREDRAILLWPAAGDWPALARRTNDALRRVDARVGGRSLAELRAQARAFVGIDERATAFVTGHQTELWHPGVWIKNAAIDAAARAVGDGVAIHVAVDTDSPKHLNVRWPHYSKPATDDARLNAAPWSGALDAATPAHLAAIESDYLAAKSSFGYEPVFGEWLDASRDVTFEAAAGSDLAKATAAAGHRLDWSLGLDYQIQTLSPWLTSEPWLAFVAHVISRADAFAANYNAALADYRAEQKITSSQRPMPDLAIDGASIELPFWLDVLGESPSRSRASVTREADRFVLRAPGGESFAIAAAPDAGALYAFLNAHRLRISPRALTLTLFTRLFVADLFIHGIGGGRYDQVTDRLIAREFGIAPPPFAVTTATMYLPQSLGRTRACVPCVLHEGHQLKHRLLGERKRELVESIAAAPRQSAERASTFATMRRTLRELEASDERIASWRERLVTTRLAETEDATVFDREVFYAMQPRDRLVGMIDEVRREFGPLAPVPGGEG